MSETDTKEETTAPAAAGEETAATPEGDNSQAKESEPSKEDATTTEKVEEKQKENTEGKSSEEGPDAKKQKLEDEKPKSDEKEKKEPEEVQAYEIDEAPETPSTDDDKINSPAVVLFGLHPLIKEAPLSKLLETYGALKSCSVRMAFASRYSSVEFETTDQAKAAYRALNNAKIMGKSVLVQPTVVKKD